MEFITRHLVLLCCLSTLAGCAKILGVFPSPGYSQFILGEKLMSELASRGHEVTVISPFSPKKKLPNYSEIKVEGIVEDVLKGFDLFAMSEENVFTSIYHGQTGFGLAMTEYVLAYPSVQELLQSNATFDLVIAEVIWNDAHMGFAQHYGVPIVLLSSIGASEWSNDLVANPSPPSYICHTASGYSNEMTITQRGWNLVLYIYELYLRHFVMLPKQNEFVQKYFRNMPHLSEFMYNASLILLNSHPAATEPVPLVPNMIEIGGFHITPETIPAHIKKFMDEATDGVVYFSMGSNLRSADMPEHIKKDLLETFSKLKQRVVWKFEDDGLSNIPENVLIYKWLPQRGILGHPNVKAFISHCGLISTIETVYLGVPTICIPMFADQKMNAAISRKNGISITMSYKELNKNTLSVALNEILYNTSYANEAKKRSRWMNDRIVDPMNTAMYWIEFVIKHRGAPHLRSAALRLRWYEYLYLDILLYSTLIIAITYQVIKKVLRLIIRSVSKDSYNQQNKTKKHL